MSIYWQAYGESKMSVFSGLWVSEGQLEILDGCKNQVFPCVYEALGERRGVAGGSWGRGSFWGNK